MRKISLAISLIILIVVSSTAAVDGTTLTFKNKTDVTGEVVCLGDISDITDTENRNQIQRLVSIPICLAPPPAETRALNIDTVFLALRNSYVDLSRLTFTGSSNVLIRREHDLLSVLELQRAFSGHISKHTGWPEDSYIARPPKNLRARPVPVGKRTISVETLPDEDFCGSVLAYFRILIDGKPTLTLTHRFTVERYTETLIAVRKIPRGHSIGSADVEITKVEQSRVYEDSFNKIEQAAGLTARQTIRPGTVLRAGLVSASPIFRKGDFAPVICSGDGFQISTKGEVLEDGSNDEVVRVRLPTRKIVRALVLDSGTLLIVR